MFYLSPNYHSQNNAFIIIFLFLGNFKIFPFSYKSASALDGLPTYPSFNPNCLNFFPTILGDSKSL